MSPEKPLSYKEERDLEKLVDADLEFYREMKMEQPPIIVEGLWDEEDQ